MIIENELEYNIALEKADSLFHAELATIDGKKLAELLGAIKAYEDLHHDVKKD